MSATIEQVIGQLTAMVRTRTGDPQARVHDVTSLPGHAGFGYSFVLERSTADDGPSGKLVLRIAPEGVRISGPADVVRQARIMDSLADTRVPVPPVIWYGDESEFFGRPYFVDGFVDGFKLNDVDTAPDEERRLGHRAVEVMAELHRVDWESRRDAWGDAMPLTEEMKRLDHLLDRPTLDPEASALAPGLREKLRSSMPARPHVGLVHGDFQWLNVLFRDGQVAALIDWEIALVGPTLLDLGWMCLFSDPDNWLGGMTYWKSPIGPDEIIETYSRASGFSLSTREVNWFRAFSSYRFGVLTVFNLMLHRRGKRPDPEWERIAVSAPLFFERGLQLLDRT